MDLSDVGVILTHHIISKAFTMDRQVLISNQNHVQSQDPKYVHQKACVYNLKIRSVKIVFALSPQGLPPVFHFAALSIPASSVRCDQLLMLKHASSTDA